MGLPIDRLHIVTNENDILYRQSIAYSFYIENPFVFQYDTSFDYEELILLRIENYILIGEIGSAIDNYNEYGFDCSQAETEYTIIECLCEVINDGNCPFDYD